MDQEEISSKLRKAIKAKLAELENYMSDAVDDELPDYIMVMIANKKDMNQMAEDLDLFLGKNARPFTEWLDSILRNLQSVAKSVGSDSKTAVGQSRTKISESQVSKSPITDSEETALLTVYAQDDEFRDDAFDEVEETKGKTSLKSKAKQRSDYSADESSAHTSSANKKMISTRGDSQSLISKSKQNTTIEAKPTNPEKKSATKRNSPERRASPERRTSPGRRDSPVRRASPAKRSSDSRREPVSQRIGNKTEQREADRPRIRDVSREKERSRDRSPLQGNPRVSSKIAAVVNKKQSSDIYTLSDNEESEEEDKYNPARPQVGAVASVIRITERKSSVPESLQANTKLLRRAMADLTRSIEPRPVPTEQATNRSSPPSEQVPVKERIGRPAGNNKVNMKTVTLKSKRPRTRSRSPVKSGKSALLEEQVVTEEDLEEALRLLEAKRQAMRKQQISKENKTFESETSDTVLSDVEEQRIPASQRVGTTNVKEQRIPVSQRVGSYVQDDQRVQASQRLGTYVLEEERTPASQRVGLKAESPKFVVTLEGAGKMKQLQSTLLDDEFDTPENQSLDALDDYGLSGVTTPNSLGSIYQSKLPHVKALPACKFGSLCTRVKCPFLHRERLSTGVSPLSLAKIVCKFFPKCTNLDCPYLHPKPCRFGVSCIRKNSGCPYTHPQLPTKNQLKWVKPSGAS